MKRNEKKNIDSKKRGSKSETKINIGKKKNI